MGVAMRTLGDGANPLWTLSGGDSLLARANSLLSVDRPGTRFPRYRCANTHSMIASVPCAFEQVHGSTPRALARNQSGTCSSLSAENPQRTHAATRVSSVDIKQRARHCHPPPPPFFT